MKKLVFLFSGLIIICSAFAQTNAQKIRAAKLAPPKNYQPLALKSSPLLQTILEKAVSETLTEFAAKKITPNDVAATLIDLRDLKNPKSASVRGDQKIYPASVVKLFYLAAIHRWLEDGKIKKLTPELERGVKDMIVDSSNDATHYVLDVLTDAPNGGELAPKDLETFAFKRNAVNRYFKSLGYDKINVNQKTYCEDLYGRERQFWNAGKNRNMLTTDATARLLAEIAIGKFVSGERSNQMLQLLTRDFSGTSKDADNQAHGFTAIALHKLNLTDAKLWSKAGWTSKTRHDAAYVETPAGLKFVLVVFTENFANERDIIPHIAEKVLKQLASIK
ncbi:MAG: class A beta-lactamase-related serine hydrolase [Pyrinomonadaceae bacterium]|nr:class A beta-lactamase-related serine hydrolase [Pyrinomonadaceae bacterium]